MRIDRISGLFHCFSCGFKGNLFSHYGQEVSEVDLRVAKLRKKVSDLLAPQSIDLPVDIMPFTKDLRGISSETLMKFGAFTSNSNGMEERIIFPTYNLTGELKVLLGRYIHSNATPKYKFYPAKVKIPLFPAIPETNQNSVVLVEGIFDFLNLYDKGMTNAVCTFGTDTISEKSVRNLFEHYTVLGIKKIFIMFDGDKAGNAGAARAEIALKHTGFLTEIIELPAGVDPGSLSEEDVQLLKGHMYENSTSRSEAK
jgi:DNA primase